jgi:hypothetical protein
MLRCRYRLMLVYEHLYCLVNGVAVKFGSWNVNLTLGASGRAGVDEVSDVPLLTKSVAVSIEHSV